LHNAYLFMTDYVDVGATQDTINIRIYDKYLHMIHIDTPPLLAVT